MTQTALATRSGGEIMERVITVGDISQLNPIERTQYYNAVCESIGVNPLTRPFEYIVLNGKMQLYARRDCTDQLRATKKISLKITSREVIDGVYIVTAQAMTPDGRPDESTGAVPLPQNPEARANAMMKAETKAKRRVTLSICGLGLLDESEVETIRDAKPAVFDDQSAQSQQPSQQQQPRQQQVNLMDEATFLHHWNQIMDARGFTAEKARKVLDDGLASKNLTLAGLNLKARHALLGAAGRGDFDDQLNEPAGERGGEPAQQPAAAPQPQQQQPAAKQPTGNAFEDFKTDAIQIGEEQGVSGGDVLAGIGKLILAKKLKGKEQTIKAEQLVEWLVAMQEQRFVWTSGQILPQQPVAAGA